MGLPYCQPGLGEIKPQIIIFLWFSFPHAERESVRKAIDCFVKHPLDPGGSACPQDMAHKGTGMARIPPSGCAASAGLCCQGKSE